MPLIPRRPFFDLENFFQDEFFPSERNLREPHLDVYEEQGELVVNAELPGVDSKDISVNITENSLKIEAKHSREEETEEKGYYKKEMSKGLFKRVITLPVEVENEDAEASYEDGVLEIRVPKLEKEQKEQGTEVEVKKN